MPSWVRGHRSALEAGTDPAVVTGWIKEVEADRLHAERELASTASVVQPLSEIEIRALVTSQRKVLRSLAKATSEQHATIYAETIASANGPQQSASVCDHRCDHPPRPGVHPTRRMPRPDHLPVSNQQIQTFGARVESRRATHCNPELGLH